MTDGVAHSCTARYCPPLAIKRSLPQAFSVHKKLRPSDYGWDASEESVSTSSVLEANVSTSLLNKQILDLGYNNVGVDVCAIKWLGNKKLFIPSSGLWVPD